MTTELKCNAFTDCSKIIVQEIDLSLLLTVKKQKQHSNEEYHTIISQLREKEQNIQYMEKTQSILTSNMKLFLIQTAQTVIAPSNQ